MDALRGSATRSTFFSIYQSTPVWSPDSSAFVFAGAEAGPPNLYLRRLGASSSAEHLSGTAAQTLFPQSWSPDGRYLAYVSMDPKTDADIWRLALSDDQGSASDPADVILGNARAHLAGRSLDGLRVG